MKFDRIAGVVTAAALALTAATSASAEQKTLRGVSCFPEGTRFSWTWEEFVKTVNDQNGPVKINYLGGGAKVMSPFEVGNAVKTGIVDIVNLTSAYYTNLIPVVDAMKLKQVDMATLRKNGGFDFLNELHKEKMNVIRLARIVDYIPFNLYLNKPITKPNLEGLKIRVTPVYREFFQDLGAVAQQSSAGEVYTLMQRGVVDGYGWPIQGIFDFSWQEVTKYRVEPSFYNAGSGILVNLDVWKSLSQEQRDFLEKNALAQEAKNILNRKGNEAARKKQEEAGIKVIRFSPEDEARWIKQAYESGWEAVMRVDPVNGPKVREFYTSK